MSGEDEVVEKTVTETTTVPATTADSNPSTPAQDVVDEVHGRQEDNSKEVVIEETTVRSEQVESD